MIKPCSESVVDIFTEEPLSLNELAKEESVNPSTIWRWHIRGVRGVSSKLSLSVGGFHDEPPAVRRFKLACTAAANGSSHKSRTPAQRDRAIAAAEIELARMGV